MRGKLTKIIFLESSTFVYLTRFLPGVGGVAIYLNGNFVYRTIMSHVRRIKIFDSKIPMPRFVFEIYPNFFVSISMFFMVAFLLVSSGTSFRESLAVSVVVAVQMVSGSYIWLRIFGDQKQDLSTLVGIGVGFGSFLSLACQQLLRTTVLGSVGWTLPTVFVIAHYLWKHEGVAQPLERIHSRNDIRSQRLFLFCIFNSSLFAMSYWWFWLLPLACVSVIVFVLLCNERASELIREYIGKWRYLAAFVVFLVFLIFALWIKMHSPFYWFMSHDQVYSESVSWSTAKFGPNESPFEFGSVMRYHWFSLGWAGIVSDAANATNWIVITKALPFVAFLATTALLWSIVLHLGGSVAGRIIAIYSFVLTMGISEFTTPVRYLHSPTFIFGNVWMLVVVLIVLKLIDHFSMSLLLLFVIMLFATFGGKSSNGSIVLFGLCSLALFGVISHSKRSRQLVVISAFAVSTAVAAYYVIFRASVTTSNALNNVIRISPGQIGWDSGLVHRGRRITSLMGSFFYFLDMSPMILPIVFLYFSTKRREPWFWFLGSIMVGGVGATFLFGHQGAAQMFFVLGGLVICPILLALYLDVDQMISSFSFRQIIVMTSGSVIGSLIWKEIWNFSNMPAVSHRSAVILRFSAVTGSLVSSALLALLICVVTQRGLRFPLVRYFQIVVSCLVITGAAYGIHVRTSRLIGTLAAQVEPTIQDDSDFAIGSYDHLAILNWIRKNTDETGIFATNRFCLPGSSPCNSKWQLVSAVSHRRMFIEGGYWFGEPTDMATKKKVKACIRFAANPTFVDWSFLVANGVDYFFVDHAVSPHLPDWEPYATEIVSNKSVTLLRLNAALSQSSNGG